MLPYDTRNWWDHFKKKNWIRYFFCIIHNTKSSCNHSFTLKMRLSWPFIYKKKKKKNWHKFCAMLTIHLALALQRDSRGWGLPIIILSYIVNQLIKIKIHLDFVRSKSRIVLDDISFVSYIMDSIINDISYEIIDMSYSNN